MRKAMRVMCSVVALSWTLSSYPAIDQDVERPIPSSWCYMVGGILYCW